MNTGPLSGEEYMRMVQLLNEPGAKVAGHLVLRLMRMVEARDALIRMLGTVSKLDVEKLLPAEDRNDLADLLQASLDVVRAHRAGGGR